MTTNSTGNRLYFCNCEHEPWQCHKQNFLRGRIIKTNCVLKNMPPPLFGLDVVYKIGGCINGTLRYFQNLYNNIPFIIKYFHDQQRLLVSHFLICIACPCHPIYIIESTLQSNGLTELADLPSLTSNRAMILLTSTADSSILRVVTRVEPQSSELVTVHQEALSP